MANSPLPNHFANPLVAAHQLILYIYAEACMSIKKAFKVKCEFKLLIFKKFKIKKKLLSKIIQTESHVNAKSTVKTKSFRYRLTHQCNQMWHIVLLNTVVGVCKHCTFKCFLFFQYFWLDLAVCCGAYLLPTEKNLLIFPTIYALATNDWPSCFFFFFLFSK